MQSGIFCGCNFLSLLGDLRIFHMHILVFAMPPYNNLFHFATKPFMMLTKTERLVYGLIVNITLPCQCEDGDTANSFDGKDCCRMCFEDFTCITKCKGSSIIRNGFKTMQVSIHEFYLLLLLHCYMC